MPRMSASEVEGEGQPPHPHHPHHSSMPARDATTTMAPAPACAQCHATGVPLLAPDEPLGQQQQVPVSPATSNKPRYCNSCMIGKKVRVFWPVDESWYTGVVHEYDPSTGEHLLRYEDGDAEWVRIGSSNVAAVAPQVNAISPGESTMAHQQQQQQQHAPQQQQQQPHQSAAVTPQQAPPPPPPSDAASFPPQPPPPEAQQAMVPAHALPPGVSYVTTGDAAYYRPGAPSNPYATYGFAPARGDQRMPPPGATDLGHHPHAHLHHASSQPHHQQHPPSQSPAELHETAASPTPTNGGRSGKKGPKAWSKNEDATLLKIVQGMSMPMRWSVVAQSLPDRTGKQCRERYVNHLNPRLKTSDWNPVEDATVFHLYNTIGSHWSTMSKVIPGRTDNGIKNRFHNLRRQLEREDGHRLRLSNENDFPDQIRLDKTRKFPKHLQGKADELWDIESGIGVLSAQSVLGPPSGGANAAAKTHFGPFRFPRGDIDAADRCVRCGFYVPSVQTGREICERTGWCLACTRIPPHLSGNLLRECLSLRRCTDNPEYRRQIESWPDPPAHVEGDTKESNSKESPPAAVQVQ